MDSCAFGCARAGGQRQQPRPLSWREVYCIKMNASELRAVGWRYCKELDKFPKTKESEALLQRFGSDQALLGPCQLSLVGAASA